MSQVSIAEAKNALTHLIHETERGEVIHIHVMANQSLFSSPRRHTNNSSPGNSKRISGKPYRHGGRRALIGLS